METTGLWSYRDQSWTTEQLNGYSVEAIDGGIGKIDEASNDVGASYIVVDTGPWIFGKKVMLPAGVISRVDHDDEQVFVNRTKDRSRKRLSSTRISTATTPIGAGSAPTTARAALAGGTGRTPTSNAPGDTVARRVLT